MLLAESVLSVVKGSMKVILLDSQSKVLKTFLLSEEFTSTELGKLIGFQNGDGHYPLIHDNANGLIYFNKGKKGT